MLKNINFFLTYTKNCVLYENINFLILNKPFGLCVHGGSGVKITLINLLYCFNTNKNNNYFYLAHRLDKETSGCLIVVKNSLFLKKINIYFKKNFIKKIYHGIVLGSILEDFTINVPLYKKNKFTQKCSSNVLTCVKPLRIFEKNNIKYTLIAIDLKTGKTHQIRAHLSYKKYPLLCDNKYGDYLCNKIFYDLGFKRLFLHAKFISFYINKKQYTINAPYDFFFKKVINYLSLL